MGDGVSWRRERYEPGTLLGFGRFGGPFGRREVGGHRSGGRLELSPQLLAPALPPPGHRHPNRRMPCDPCHVVLLERVPRAPTVAGHQVVLADQPAEVVRGDAQVAGELGSGPRLWAYSQ